jgi:3-dehydroquinate synthase
LRELTVHLPGRDLSYRVLVAPGLRASLAQHFKALDLPRRLVVISDRRVSRLHGDQVLTGLEVGGFKPELLTVAPGERSKNWATVQALTRELLARGAHRRTPLVALGGGVVGDLTGFLASLYMRGVPLVQVPTTLLAMVDAALGGKTAINLPQGKNLLGTFHQPRLVAIDPEFLQTLAGKERKNGLAEVLKAGFIRDADLLAHLQTVRPRIFREPEVLADTIFRAVAIKAAVVAADEREADLRRILNFGHTLGHALEAASRFRLPHGQAVAYGMLAALEISRRFAGLAADACAFGQRLIREFGLATRPLDLPRQAVLAALPLDKKREGAGLVLVLLRELGESVIQTGVPLSLVAEVLEQME